MGNAMEAPPNTAAARNHTRKHPLAVVSALHVGHNLVDTCVQLLHHVPSMTQQLCELSTSCKDVLMAVCKVAA